MKRFIIAGVLSLCIIPSLFAQESRKYEIGANASFGFSLGNTKANNYGFDFYGGYSFSGMFSAGLGVNYVNYFGRADLPSGIENVIVSTGSYHAFRPYVYGRFYFLPLRKWNPFVGARFGYAFFSDSNLSYAVDPLVFGPVNHYGDADLSEYEYLKALDHTLGIKGNVFGSVDFGISCRINNKGSRFSLGVALDLQPATFEYNKTDAAKWNMTIGPKVSFSF